MMAGSPSPLGKRHQAQTRLRVGRMANLTYALGTHTTSFNTNIWKPIPVRIFYTFVIYQGYDMDNPIWKKL